MNVTVADATTESFLTGLPDRDGEAERVQPELRRGPDHPEPRDGEARARGGKVDVRQRGGIDARDRRRGRVLRRRRRGRGRAVHPAITPVAPCWTRRPTSNGGWAGRCRRGPPGPGGCRNRPTPDGVPATATAVVANVTVTGGTAQSFVSVWPSGEAQPNVSNLNLLPGQTIPNLVIGEDRAHGGRSGSPTPSASVEVIVDVVGYFDPTAGSTVPRHRTRTAILDTRSGTGLAGAAGPGSDAGAGGGGRRGHGRSVGGHRSGRQRDRGRRHGRELRAGVPRGTSRAPIRSRT